MTFLLLTLACTSGGGGECVDDGNCDDGQACIEGTCMDVECLASEDCDIGHFCQLKTHTCQPGCHEDSDCLAGEQCNQGANQCEQAGCRNTELDCHAGEVCDPVSGQCTDAGACEQSCHVYDSPNCGPGVCLASTSGTCNVDQDCEQGSTCDLFLTSDDTCYSVGDCPAGTDECYFGQCVANYCHTDYCYEPCDGGECPAAFSCVDYGASGVCLGDCGYLIENGYL